MAENAHHNPRSVQHPPMRHKLPPAILALVLGAAGLALAMHYPIAPAAMTAMALVCCVTFFVWPYLWLLLLPALLPVIGLAPWTGWITFEEQDILILAVAAGSYARLAWSGQTNSRADPSRQHRQGRSALVWLLLGLFALSTAVSMFRGFADAGGVNFGWFQGYHEPMNSVRLAKSFFEALLLLPLWRVVYKPDPQRAQNLLSQGLMLGLAAAALATLWERMAFTGLLNFSSDYRTTGLFWEMHVGGAALDGFLAITVPFAVRELVQARTPVRWGVSATATALACYACLTTFSRGVYLAVPVGLVVYFVLKAKNGLPRSARNDDGDDGANSSLRGRLPWRSMLPGVLLVAGFGVGAGWMFQTSGYRGAAALLGAMALMLPLTSVLRPLPLSQWMAGGVGGLLLAALAIGIAWLVPKGAYVAYALGFVFTALMYWSTPRHASSTNISGPTVLAGFMATLASMVLVAGHWGSMQAVVPATAAAVACLLLVGATGMARRPLWPDAIRWQAGVVCVMAPVVALISVFGGGAYMGDRFSTGGRDLDTRLAQWKLGADMLRGSADWSLGKGLGRFPANYFMVGDPHEHPGDYRLKHEGDHSYLTLAGGSLVNGWGEIFRVTQRVSEPGKSAVVTARVRAEKDVTLHFEVCEKHLLYSQGCVLKQVRVKGLPGVWQDLRGELQGDGATRGAWYAPRLLAFSMAMESRGGLADLDDVALTSADGRQLLANGGFTEDMAHWFFSSDRYHMPWHIKSMYMDVLFDQGIIGATLWGLLLAGALWRTSVGVARRHPLAPVMAASMAGFAVVGLFDSLLDVPRLAWLFYLVLLVALTLRGQYSGLARPHGVRAAAGLTVMVTGCWLGLQSGEARADVAEYAPQVIRVGPQKTIKTIAAAGMLAGAGATIEVDSGEYLGDTTVWTQDRINLRAVGGRVKLIASGAAAEGKAIWVVRANGMRVEGFDFESAAVPDRNGAGIRLERGSLLVRDCRFMHNEMGLLTNNDPDTVLEIENSEFAYNQRPDGHNHNLYAGQIARLSVTGSYFHHAHIGHLLKSRAAVNYIYNNRLTDEADGTASYELEFPNGGIAYVVGNTIAQSTGTENPQLISFGAEGYKWPHNEIYLASNTLVNPLPRGGVFLWVAPGADAIRAVNNRLVGSGKLESAGPGEYRNNASVDPRDYARGLRNSTHNPVAVPGMMPPPN